MSAFSIILLPPLLLLPSLVSFVFKLINLDELYDHNNLQVFEFFTSLQPACRTTAASFETVALSRQTVLTRIISLEVSYAAGLQSEICLPFLLNAPFSFYISFCVFMVYFFLFVWFGFFNNEHTKWSRKKRWKHSHSWVSRVHKGRLQPKENVLRCTMKHKQKNASSVIHTFKSLGCSFKYMQTNFSKIFNSKQVLQILFQKSQTQNVTYSCCENW